LQDGVAALTAVGTIFRNNVLAKGVIPQISLVLGPCAGAACYSPALTDFLIIAADHTKMFLTGPAVTFDFIGEIATLDELGGAEIHSHNGVADLVAPDAPAAIQLAKSILNYLPASGVSRRTLSSSTAGNQDGPLVEEAVYRRLETTGTPVIPESATQPYDVRAAVLQSIFDEGTWLELQPQYAPNLVTGLARLAGTPVAIVANQPQVLAGTLDADATDKGARFINTVAGLGLPIITFIDVPGFLPGTTQEKAGIIRKGANLVSAYTSAKVPKINIIMRKAFGGAYIALDSMALGATKVFAWPNAEIAIMGAAGAVDVLHHRALSELPPHAAAHHRAELIAQLQSASPGLAAAVTDGQITAIIQPSETRDVLIGALN
jgi:propionyl-CoA carboxylase beta chain